MAGRNNRTRDSRLSDVTQGAGASPDILGSMKANSAYNRGTIDTLILAGALWFIIKKVRS